MEYRKLGNTSLEVSAVGLGCAQLGSSNTDYTIRMIKRAIELGINYFDTARGYGDSELKLGQALKGIRDRVRIATKTGAKTKEEAWQQIQESLDRLQTDHVEVCHLHGLQDSEDLDIRLGKGGAIEALQEARERGWVRHIGCTSHTSQVLVAALERFDFEVILVPMNLVEREPLEELIPLCHERGVGVTIMKPLATGLLPAGLALKWLLNQPIATAVPGATTLEELEEDAPVGHLVDLALTPHEEAQVEWERWKLDRVRCRLCQKCEPCPQNIPIADLLGTDDIYDHYRTMGPQAFAQFPWSRMRVEKALPARERVIATIQSCTRCGICEERCPHNLPIMRMLAATVPSMQDMLRIWKGLYPDKVKP